MESWPLQLGCEEHSDRWLIALTEQTVIEGDAGPVGLGSLLPGIEVVIEGETSGPHAMRARRITVLSSTR